MISAPRFTRPALGPDLSVVGTSNYAPSSHPLQLVTRGAEGAMSYENLFVDIGPDGKPVTYFHPGTFGMVVAASKGRG